jgi:archaellum component FlaC
MVGKRTSQAVTKSDFNELKSDFAKLLQKLDQKFDAIDQRFSGVDSSIQSISADLRSVKVQTSVLIQKVDFLEEGQRRLPQIIDTRFAERIEPFMALMETLRRDTAVYPRILDEQAATLRGHEGRISALEARKAP